MKQKRAFERLILFLLVAVALVATVQSCSAQPTQRIKLTQLEKSTTQEGTKAGQIGLTNAAGDQRYAQFTEIQTTPINYVPTATGNLANISEFVEDSLSRIWYIDWQGNAILLNDPETCDQDWLRISDNGCPEALTDSLYKYKYASIGARYVWPNAELLVSDSVAVGQAVISGDRNARVVLHDNQNGTESVLDQGGSQTTQYIESTAEGGVYQIATSTGTQGTPFIQTRHVTVNASDSTFQLNQYPNTLNDPGTPVNVLTTATNGKVESHPVSEVISAAGGVTGAGLTNRLGVWQPGNYMSYETDFRVDTINSFLGIGVAAANAKLSVGGTIGNNSAILVNNPTITPTAAALGVYNMVNFSGSATATANNQNLNGMYIGWNASYGAFTPFSTAAALSINATNTSGIRIATVNPSSTSIADQNPVFETVQSGANNQSTSLSITKQSSATGPFAIFRNTRPTTATAKLFTYREDANTVNDMVEVFRFQQNSGGVLSYMYQRINNGVTSADAIVSYFFLPYSFADASHSLQLYGKSASLGVANGTAPKAKLEIVSTGTTSLSYGLLVTNAGGATSTASISVRDDGLVGIGTNAPTQELTVVGDIATNHLQGRGSAPTVTVNTTTCGTGATATVAGYDLGFVVTVTFGTTPSVAGGELFRINYNTTLPGVGIPVMFPGDDAGLAADLVRLAGAYTANEDNTDFELWSNGDLSSFDSDVLKFNFHVIAR